MARIRSIGFEIIHILFVNRPDRDHHDLNMRAGGEVAYLAEFGGVIEEEFKRGIGVERAEMVFSDLQGFIDAFLDRDGGDDNDKFGKAIAFVEFKDRAQIDVGFAGAGFHLDGEIAGREGCRRFQTVAELNVVEVGVEFIVEQLQAVTDAQVALGESQGLLRVGVAMGDGEFGAADFLTTKQVADGFDSGALVIKIGFKVEFHGRS